MKTHERQLEHMLAHDWLTEPHVQTRHLTALAVISEVYRKR